MIPDFVRRSIAPVFTAFDEEGRLDDDGQRAILDHLLSTRAVSAHFVRCGLGRMYTFGYEDVRQIARSACRHVNGRAPVLVGTTGVWDRDRSARPDPDVFLTQALELSKYAEGEGAAGVVHTMPEAILPKDGQTPADVILQYFETVSAAVKVPVFIYQPPGTDKDYCVTHELVKRLADLPNVVGMKLSTNDAEYILDITYALRGKDFAFISGAETAFLTGLISGSRAVIGQGATVNPQILNAIQDRYERGDLAGAVEAQYTTNLLVQRSTNCVEFYKLWIAEKGYKVKPYDRTMKREVYGKTWSSIPQEEYISYKRLLESELAKYA